MNAIQNNFNSITINGGNVAVGNNISGDLAQADSSSQGDFFLESLCFPSMNDRFNQIKESYGETCKWIYERRHPDNQDRPWQDFVQWLETDDTIYWIAGKPGSGKSTLMKYLVSEDSTRSLLTNWNAHRKVVVVSHFFWRPGSFQQNGLEGCLRTLLFQLIDQVPEIGQRIQLSTLTHFGWTSKILLKALETVLADSQTSFCIFIDGLDEFVGDSDSLDTLIEFIEQASHRPNAKVCVSSRPELFFRDTFGPYRGLRLQDFNVRDLHATVEGRLMNNMRFKQYFAHDRRNAERLISDMVDRSEGVFLWTQLALEQVMRGLKQHDSLNTLQQRLQSFGRSLDTLFEALLERIDDFNGPLSASILKIQLCQAYPPRLDNEHESFFGNDDEVSLLLLYVMMNDALKEYNTDAIDINELFDPATPYSAALVRKHSDALHDLEERIPELTGGLLESTSTSPDFYDRLATSDFCCRHGERYGLPVDESWASYLTAHFDGIGISVVHRTVLEFLKESPIAQQFFMRNTCPKLPNMRTCCVDSSLRLSAVTLRSFTDSVRYIRAFHGQQRENWTYDPCAAKALRRARSLAAKAGDEYRGQLAFICQLSRIDALHFPEYDLRGIAKAAYAHIRCLSKTFADLSKLTKGLQPMLVELDHLAYEHSWPLDEYECAHVVHRFRDKRAWWFERWSQLAMSNANEEPESEPLFSNIIRMINYACHDILLPAFVREKVLQGWTFRECLGDTSARLVDSVSWRVPNLEWPNGLWIGAYSSMVFGIVALERQAVLDPQYRDAFERCLEAFCSYLRDEADVKAPPVLWARPQLRDRESYRSGRLRLILKLVSPYNMIHGNDGKTSKAIVAALDDVGATRGLGMTLVQRPALLGWTEEYTCEKPGGASAREMILTEEDSNLLKQFAVSYALNPFAVSDEENELHDFMDRVFAGTSDSDNVFVTAMGPDEREEARDEDG